MIDITDRKRHALTAELLSEHEECIALSRQQLCQSREQVLRSRQWCRETRLAVADVRTQMENPWLAPSIAVRERRVTPEQLEVLVAELQHRNRNLLSLVKGLAERALSSSASLEDFRRVFRARLDALVRVQQLLTGNQDAIALARLVRDELSAHGVGLADPQVCL